MACCAPFLGAQAASNPWMTSYSDRETWKKKLLNPDEYQFHIALLLTLLPNLRRLRMIGGHWFFMGPIRETLRAITAANNNPQSPLNGKALGKLRNVMITYDEPMGGEWFWLYYTFANLPSIRCLHGWGIDGAWLEDDREVLQASKLGGLDLGLSRR